MVSVMCSERYSYQFLVLDLFRRQFVGGGFANSVCSCVVGSRSYQGSVCRVLVVNASLVRLFNWMKDVMRSCSSAGHRRRRCASVPTGASVGGAAKPHVSLGGRQNGQ